MAGAVRVSRLVARFSWPSDSVMRSALEGTLILYGTMNCVL